MLKNVCDRANDSYTLSNSAFTKEVLFKISTDSLRSKMPENFARTQIIALNHLPRFRWYKQVGEMQKCK